MKLFKIKYTRPHLILTHEAYVLCGEPKDIFQDEFTKTRIISFIEQIDSFIILGDAFEALRSEIKDDEVIMSPPPEEEPDEQIE